MIDTNVLVAALRSSTGASHEVFLAADRGEFEVALSVPLLAEYDDVCHRAGSGILIPASAINDVINRIAQFARQQTIHYLWRGILPDPKDDMVLEVAVAAGATHLVTFNCKHLKQASEFGIAVVTPLRVSYPIMSTLSLRIPDSLHRTLKSAAEQDGVSINQFVSLAVAEKLSALQTYNLIAEKAAKGSQENFLKAMSMVPAGEVVEGDEIPAKYKSSTSPGRKKTSGK